MRVEITAGKTINSTAIVATPAGINGAIQFNDNGSFSASNNLLWDNVNSVLIITGSVGINNGSPSRSLAIGVAGDGSSAIANQWELYSDARLKENIIALSYGLSEILLLNPVSFNYIRDYDKKIHLGLIAQEVKEIIPEAVNYDGEYFSLDYLGLIGVLINAIKELHERIKQLEENGS